MTPTLILEEVAHIEAAVMILEWVANMVGMDEVAVLAEDTDIAEAAGTVVTNNLEGGEL